MHFSLPIILFPALILLLSKKSDQSLVSDNPHSCSSQYRPETALLFILTQSVTIKQAIPVLLVHQGSLLFASRIYTDSWSFLRTYTAP